jgi:hypothetical protein
MRPQLSFLWTSNRTIDRGPYVLTGVLLFLVKFGLDWLVATRGFGESWSLMHYLIWPNDRVLRVFDLTAPDRVFALTMLGISLPFIWTGVVLTLHRLRSAGLPPGLVLFFFVPLVNLLLFLVLSLLPTQPASEAEADADASRSPAPPAPRRPDLGSSEARRLRRLRDAHLRIVRDSHWRSGLVALAITVPLAVLGVVLGAEVLQSYGFSLFVGGPFALGMISVLMFGFSRPQSLGACMLVAFTATALAGMGLLVVALEGAICLIMAAPIVFFLSSLGALVGYMIQARPWLNDQLASVALAVVLALPALMAAESAGEPEPEIRVVRTVVIIDAPPEQVWPHVIAFPPLPEPDDWFFQTGVAYPQRAEIHGEGVGAVRHCVFSTGTFVEPIDVWEAPTLLRFRVTEQPEPMEEWSPYQLHPAHLDHYLVSRQGQFLLEALPGGRTRLEGSTWYSNRMWPAAYWNLWSDWIIHRIHGRVLTHIRQLAEAK